MMRFIIYFSLEKTANEPLMNDNDEIHNEIHREEH